MFLFIFVFAEIKEPLHHPRRRPRHRPPSDLEVTTQPNAHVVDVDDDVDVFIDVVE